ncbi:MAG: DUF3179 domain-containing protein [Anaerolineales bacterium]
MISGRSVRLSILVTGIAVFASACTQAIAASSVEDPSNTQTDIQKPAPQAEAGQPSGGEAAEISPTEAPDLLAPEEPPLRAEQEFSTDFSRHTIPYSEILSGGPPKDGIPAIDNPQFVSVVEADEWLEDLEPVTVFQEGELARIYPMQILIWHEIVNDVVAGRPVTVTFCPLCNTAIVFDATVEGRSLDFGTTGRLRFSNLLMYDRQTESWWQQATGEAVIGELTGTQLIFLPASFISWSEAKETYPDAQVLSRDTGYSRPYGNNPYVGYDNVSRSPFLYDGPSTPGQLPPMARVTTVDLDGEAVAYPNDVLAQEGAVNDTVAGQELVVIWQPGLASALDQGSIAAGQDVGANGVFIRQIEGLVLTFAVDGDRIVDEQTGSEWNVLGQAIRGELEGAQLTPVVKVDHFWFSWAAFRPETRSISRSVGDYLLTD